MSRAPKARQSRYVASYVSLVVMEPTEIIILMLTCHGVVRGVALFKGHYSLLYISLPLCTYSFTIRCVSPRGRTVFTSVHTRRFMCFGMQV